MSCEGVSSGPPRGELRDHEQVKHQDIPVSPSLDTFSPLNQGVSSISASFTRAVSRAHPVDTIQPLGSRTHAHLHVHPMQGHLPPVYLPRDFVLVLVSKSPPPGGWAVTHMHAFLKPLGLWQGSQLSAHLTGPAPALRGILAARPRVPRLPPGGPQTGSAEEDAPSSI